MPEFLSRLEALLLGYKLHFIKLKSITDDIMHFVHYLTPRVLARGMHYEVPKISNGFISRKTLQSLND